MSRKFYEIMGQKQGVLVEASGTLRDGRSEWQAQRDFLRAGDGLAISR